MLLYCNQVAKVAELSLPGISPDPVPDLAKQHRADLMVLRRACAETVNYGTVDCGAGLQATVSAAGWLSCAPLLQQVVVTTDSQHTLAVLLTTLSTQDHQAARQQVAEVFHHSLLNSGGDVQDALERTCRAIGGHLGAGCLLLCIDHARQTAFLAAGSHSLGGASVSHLQHGLAAQYTCADFLSAPGLGLAGLPQPEVLRTTRLQLLPCHESILLGSWGLWDQLDKDDAALHTHFHLKGYNGSVMPHAQSLSLAAPSVGADLSAPVLPVAPEYLPNTARHVVAHARDRAGRQAAAPSRRDLVALCITLRWPMTSLNHAYQDHGMSLLERYPVPHSRARMLWRLARALCVDCRRARRQMLVRKWHGVVRQEVRAATARAKQLETRAWLEKGIVLQVSPGGKARDQSGRAVDLRRLLGANGAGISAIH